MEGREQCYHLRMKLSLVGLCDMSIGESSDVDEGERWLTSRRTINPVEGILCGILTSQETLEAVLAAKLGIYLLLAISLRDA